VREVALRLPDESASPGEPDQLEQDEATEEMAEC